MHEANRCCPTPSHSLTAQKAASVTRMLLWLSRSGTSSALSDAGHFLDAMRGTVLVDLRNIYKPEDTSEMPG